MFNKSNTETFSIDLGAEGEKNQARGFGLEMSRKFNSQTFFADPSLVSLEKGKLKPSNYDSYTNYKSDVFKTLDSFFENRKNEKSPECFVVAYSQSDNEKAGENCDTLFKAVKEYYAEKKKGKIKTVVLTSGVYDYKNADYVNLPDHMLKPKDEKELCKIKEKNKKTKYIVGKGTINNMSKVRIGQEYNALMKSGNFSPIKNNAPNAIFCLGGRVQGEEIKFDAEVTEKIIKKAETLAKKGYNIYIVNGPRTPSDATDKFYEFCKNKQNMRFYNSKPIAKNEKEAENFRNYSGKYEKEFKAQVPENVYPAILGLKNVLAIHTHDSFASTETSKIGIPTVVDDSVKIDREKRPDCYKLAKIFMSLDEYIAKDFRNPKKMPFTPLPSPTKDLAEIVKKDAKNENSFLNYAFKNMKARG